MCYSVLNNPKRQFRIVKKEYPKSAQYVSNVVYYVQQSRTAPHTDCFHTIRAYCCADPEEARQQAELLLSLLQAPCQDTKKVGTTAAPKSVEGTASKTIATVQEPEKVALPAFDAKTATYKQMQDYIKANNLAIKRNLGTEAMRQALLSL